MCLCGLQTKLRLNFQPVWRIFAWIDPLGAQPLQSACSVRGEGEGSLRATACPGPAEVARVFRDRARKAPRGNTRRQRGWKPRCPRRAPPSLKGRQRRRGKSARAPSAALLFICCGASPPSPRAPLRRGRCSREGPPAGMTPPPPAPSTEPPHLAPETPATKGPPPCSAASGVAAPAAKGAGEGSWEVVTGTGGGEESEPRQADLAAALPSRPRPAALGTGGGGGSRRREANRRLPRAGSARNFLGGAEAWLSPGPPRRVGSGRAGGRGLVGGGEAWPGARLCRHLA